MSMILITSFITPLSLSYALAGPVLSQTKPIGTYPPPPPPPIVHILAGMHLSFDGCVFVHQSSYVSRLSQNGCAKSIPDLLSSRHVPQMPQKA